MFCGPGSGWRRNFIIYLYVYDVATVQCFFFLARIISVCLRLSDAHTHSQAYSQTRPLLPPYPACLFLPLTLFVSILLLLFSLLCSFLSLSSNSLFIILSFSYFITSHFWFLFLPFLLLFCFLYTRAPLLLSPCFSYLITPHFLTQPSVLLRFIRLKAAKEEEE